MLQTYLPYPSFVESAKCLDNKTLDKQRIDIQSILNSLSTNDKYSSSQICKMWKGYEYALKYYYNCVVLEYEHRGFENKLSPRYYLEVFFVHPTRPQWKFPPCIGAESFHLSQKKILLKNNPKWYSKFNWR